MVEQRLTRSMSKGVASPAHAEVPQQSDASMTETAVSLPESLLFKPAKS